MHKHHIFPKHLGGSNDPENLVLVTAEEHARIHHSLWILGGRWQDEVAWRILSGQIGKEGSRRLAISRALKGKPGTMTGKKHSEETKRKMSIAARGNKNSSGHKHSEESKQKMRGPKTEEHKINLKKSWYPRGIIKKWEARRNGSKQ